MLAEARSIIDWARLDSDEFAKRYAELEFRNFRALLEHRIRNDSIRILRRFDLSDRVFFQVRQKNPTSLLAKIRGLAKSVTAGNIATLSRTEGLKIELEKEYKIYELVKDIVAVRYISMDYPSLETLLSFMLRSGTFTIRDFEIYRPFFLEYEPPRDRPDELFLSFANVAPPIISKSSNYESIHLEIVFSSPLDIYPITHRSPLDSPTSRGYSSSVELDDSEFDLFTYRMEIQNSLFNRLSEPSRSLISMFPIEAQIRTASQHLWAQDEHRYIYSVVKDETKKFDGVLLEQTKSAFVALKFFLHSADSIRNLIHQMHYRHVAQAGELIGNGIEISERMDFFQGDQFDAIRDDLARLDARASAYAAARRANKNAEPQFWKNAVADLSRIVNEASTLEDSYFSGRHNGTLEYWGRQRIVAMILGFVLLYCIEDSATDAPSFTKEVRAALRQVEFLGPLVVDEQYLVFPNYVANLAAKAYDFVRINDRYFIEYATAQEKLATERIFDPLVFARHASALYRLGEFSAAFRTLGEFFESRHFADFDWDKYDGHSKTELRSRLLQYFWYRCALSEDQIVAQISVFERLTSDVWSAVAETKSKDEEAAKAACWATWIEGILLAFRVPLSRSLEQAFAKLRRHFEKVVDDPTVRDALKHKVYFHAALASLRFRGGMEAEARLSLSEAQRTLDSGVPHPASAIAVQEGMLAALHSEISEARFKWDVFVSYSTEDRQFVRELVRELENVDLNVFVDFQAISFGDQITPTIEIGLRRSRDVILVVTRSYLERKWTELERIWFETREAKLGETKMFVILKGLELQEFRNRYPTLADRRILPDGGDLKSVVDEIAQSLKQRAQS